MRRIPAEVLALKTGVWQTGIGRTLRGKTLGIYGFGRIGEVVAGYGKAFGMRVLVWGREGARARAAGLGFDVAPDKDSFFASCDVLSLHIRLVPATRGIVSAAICAHEARCAARQYQPRRPHRNGRARNSTPGRPSRHGSDRRFRKRTGARRKPSLLRLENVVATPHIGYVTRDEYELQFADIFDQIVAYAAGAPINIVNPAALR